MNITDRTRAETTEDGELMVELDRVSTSLGGNPVMRDISLRIARGEFFSIIGPSGCGKTTTLKVLGGFLIPDLGAVRLDGREVTRTPPNKREVNTVFQSYALFTHLNLADNIAYGLKNRGLPRAEISKRVSDALDLVGMSARAHHKPQDLSGGQRQRIALARALVNLPKLLLLDEPLGALDLNLRRQMQDELKRIHREVGVCFVYVTHDQEEALTMSDTVAVMNEGRLEQVATPRDLYERPTSAFVATFVGGSNVFQFDPTRPEQGVAVKPERIALCTAEVPAELAGRVPGTIVESSYLGSEVHYTVATLEHGEIKVKRPCEYDAQLVELDRGAEVVLAWHPEFAVALDG